MPNWVSMPMCTVMELSQRFYAGLSSFSIFQHRFFSSIPILTHSTGLPGSSERSGSAELATELILRQGLLTSIAKEQAWLTNLMSAFVSIASEGTRVKSLA